MTPFGIADNLCLSNGALVAKIQTKSLIWQLLFGVSFLLM